ncbi:Gfo/Idh/MocA family oxidoreductase, partial [bacterium]|nr:Gfo/Idh/MocA family oxidoreductase [bacterium]
ALQAGKNVLCEKPMALTAKDCKMMVHASLRENRKLFIVKQNRYNPPVVAIKELMKAKKMGRIYSIVLNCYWNRNDDYYNQSDWKGFRTKDGGALFTQFSHFIDLMLWFGGGVSSVYTLAKNYNHPNIDIEDAGIVALKFDDGTIGSINFTNNSYAKNMEGSITIFDEKGTVKIGGQYLNELEYQVIAGGGIQNLETSAKANDYGTYQGSMSNHDKVYENVVDSLTNGGKVAVNGIEGMLTVEMIEAAYKSMESGTPIFL